MARRILINTLHVLVRAYMALAWTLAACVALVITLIFGFLCSMPFLLLFLSIL